MKGTFILLLFFFTAFSSLKGQSRNRLLPDFGVVQYAGSIGYASAGFGYTFLKENARFSAHFGVVPKNRGGMLNVISAKLYFKPATFTIWNRVRMNPFDIGVMASYHYGDNFEEKWPEGVHPKGYYWWHPAFRTHLGMESSVSYEFKKGHSLRSITGYVEFNTNELYFVSFIKNIETVSFWDIVKVGTGARIYF
jgi:hypothetical protein